MAEVVQVSSTEQEADPAVKGNETVEGFVQIQGDQKKPSDDDG